MKRNLIQICLLGAAMLGLSLASNARATDGSPVWTNFFNGSGNDNDLAYSAALDSSGNVYVTGQGGNSDYATIKYSNAGIPQWTNFYNGTAL